MGATVRGRNLNSLFKIIRVKRGRGQTELSVSPLTALLLVEDGFICGEGNLIGPMKKDGQSDRAWSYQISEKEDH